MRLLTLTGPGGCGKTRLALELAQRLEPDFEDGVRLVELAPIADPALVVQETATALGVQLRSEHDPVEVLARQIGERRLLLVLDNCEHLLDATVHLADELLRACPNLRVLATSREWLRVPGEVAWRVPPLSLPDAAEHPDLARLERFEAVSLFCQRAAEAAPGFALSQDNAVVVAEICRRLDGMPLALELAAARVSALSPGQIAERLGDALVLLRGGSRAGLTRQQTLRATLAWSHDLLSEPERTLYRRLGVFAGGFGLEAVEAVCSGDALPAEEVLDLLVQLIEKSLVQVETGYRGRARYRLLETLRQDARERLKAAGERADLESAHRAFYLTLAEAANRNDNLDAAEEWPIERVEAESDDLRTALTSAIRRDPTQALRLASELWWFWMARGFFAEGARWLESALAAAPDPTHERARALVALGAIDVRRRWILRSVTLGGEALDIARMSGDRHAEARALERLGVMGMGSFHWRAADQALCDGLVLAQELGDDAVTAAIRFEQGVLAGCRGETATARGLFNEALPLLEELPEDGRPLFWAMHIAPMVIPVGRDGAPRYFFEDTFCLFRSVGRGIAIAYVHLNIGETYRTDGDCTAAREHLERALMFFRALDAERGVGVALTALGNLARQTGTPEDGQLRFEEALAIRRAAGDPREVAMTTMGMALLALSVGRTAEGEALIAETNAIFERTEDAPGLTMLPLNLGYFALDHGDVARACELFDLSARFSRERGVDHLLGWALTGLAEASLAAGEPGRAQPAIEEAVAAFERCGDLRGARRALSLDSDVPGARAADESSVSGC